MTRISFDQCVEQTKVAMAKARKEIDKTDTDWKPAYSATAKMLEVLHTPRHMADSELEQWLELCRECNLLVDEYYEKRWKEQHEDHN